MNINVSNFILNKKIFLFALSLLVFGPAVFAFEHPGGMHPKAQVQLVRQQLKQQKEPYVSAYKQLIHLADSALIQEHHALSDFSVPGYYKKPDEHIRNSKSLATDAFNAYSCALAWQLNGEKKYADRALYFIHAWSSINKSYSESDGQLVMSYTGTAMVMAAELMSSYRGWNGSDKQRFAEWVKTVYRKATNEIRIRKNNWADWGRFGSVLSDYYLDDSADLEENIRLFKSDIFNKIAADGHMPEETRRGANGIWYTYFSLAPMTATAWVAYNATGEDLFALQQGGSSLKAATDYLLYYNQHPGEWKWFENPVHGSTESKFSDLDMKTHYSFWPANLIEAMSGLFNDAKYAVYVAPYRPQCYEAHHFAWVFPTLMPARMDGYKKSKGPLHKQSKISKNFYLGIDNSGDKCNPDEFFNPAAMEALGVDFVVYHYRGPQGTIEDEAKKMERLANSFSAKGLKVIVNVESGNWSMDMANTDGHNWVMQPNNLHLFKFPPEVLKSLNKSPAVWGVLYDELEHSQITRNLTISLRNPGVELVSLAETTGMDFKSADNAVYEGAKSLVDECKSFGTRKVFTEHVWPVLFHNFARAGITPVYKQMKENWSNVWAACAMGASLQYNKELWTCVDFWNYNTFPGHSANELWGNLLFAYWAGLDKAYVESIGNHTYEITGQGQVKLKERGEALSRFAKEYLPQNPRPYSFRDYEPEIAIIRFDDTEWGQGKDVFCSVNEMVNGKNMKVDLYWKDWLFGAYNLHTSPASEEWIRAWHTITHGMVKKESLSWNATNYYKDMPHRSFAPANSPIVFDDLVTKEHLQTVRLAFLCGLFISGNTLADVAALVKENGLVVVTSPRFAPRKFADTYSGGTKEFAEGKGKWIITDDMAGDDLKSLVKPWIGKDDEIVCKFKRNRKVTMKISSDGNELDIVKANF